MSQTRRHSYEKLPLWKCIVVASVLHMIILSVVDSYTVEELQTRCMPCIQTTTSFVSHPTKCTEYFFCDYQFKWTLRLCSASTHFDVKSRTCVDPRQRTKKVCAYNQEIDNVDLDIYQVPQCAHLAFTTTVVTNSTDIDATEPTVTETNTGGAGKPVSVTTLLAVLLAVTFLILILVVIGILLYRRRQKRRRPANFYQRRLPQASGLKPSVPSPAANAAYLTRSLLNNEEETVMSTPGEYEVPSLSEEAGYMEVSDRASKAYYSDPAPPMRPPMALPANVSRAGEGNEDDNIYSEADLPEYSDGYTHPANFKRNSADNHLYSTAAESCPTPDTLDVEDPYDYCKPESANPTLSVRGGAPPPSSMSPDSPQSPESPSYYVDPTADITLHTILSEGRRPSSPPHYVDPTLERLSNTGLGNAPSPPTNRAESPPYYVDPIPEETPRRAPHQYHTLEPLLKKSS